LGADGARIRRPRPLQLSTPGVTTRRGLSLAGAMAHPRPPLGGLF
jgi:hypothetical protein